MPVKKSIRAKKPRRMNTSPRLSQYTRLITRHIGFRSMGLAMICIITAGMLIGSHQFSRPADDATVDTQRDNVAIEADATEGSVALAPKSTANAAAADVPAVVSAAKGPEAKLTPVTITGCLERADETTFRLKDTIGVDAPKSRSWKSGFLRKSSASIEVVDAEHRLKLPDHVGQKVSVTGTLVDHEMQVRSLQRVATSCTNNPKVSV